MGSRQRVRARRDLRDRGKVSARVGGVHPSIHSLGSNEAEKVERVSTDRISMRGLQSRKKLAKYRKP
eukprot:4985933-Prymnesium_polylepis.1